MTVEMWDASAARKRKGNRARRNKITAATNISSRQPWKSI